ncbi:Fis family transcriptional regulator [Sorangium cellulosum]|uniref:Fis family transcriptional regulator n=2 Tax=Polyangiaceae TaxID=49 RepID=A0A150QS93_SORCE|nr:Fis family transcriptional regulator [Sorangium cellulosum]
MEDSAALSWRTEHLRSLGGGMMTRVLWVEDDSEVRLVGASERWTRAMDELRRLTAHERAPLLITGEPGTGKELCARYLHGASPRAGGPFVAVSAARLPAERLGDELFGVEARADGRPAARPGLIELAQGGTLFLDEIGALPLDLQQRLVGVLDGEPLCRIGGEGSQVADVRVIAATSRDLRAQVIERSFHPDLHQRVGALGLSLPPLRERDGDVRRLVEHFLERQRGATGLAGGVSPGALAQLEAYPWPGNVRELRSVVERAFLLAHGAPLDLEHLPPEIGAPSLASAPPRPGTLRPSPPARGSASLGEAVRRHILAVYAAQGGNVTRTASALGITRVSLRRHLRQYLAAEARGKEPLSD